MNPVSWFEIPVIDMDRAEEFYQNTLGMELARQEEKDGYLMSWFPMTMGEMGAAGTLMKGEGYTPSHDGSLVYFSVPSIDETLAKIEAAGQSTLLPKKDIGEYGYVAWFQDTEGNRVALHEAKPQE